MKHTITLVTLICGLAFAAGTFAQEGTVWHATEYSVTQTVNAAKQEIQNWATDTVGEIYAAAEAMRTNAIATAKEETLSDLFDPQEFKLVVSPDTPTNQVLKAKSHACHKVTFDAKEPAGKNNARVAVDPEGLHNFSIMVTELPSNIVNRCLIMSFSEMLDKGIKIYATPVMVPLQDVGGQMGWSITTNDLPCRIVMEEPVAGKVIVRKEKLTESEGVVVAENTYVGVEPKGFNWAHAVGWAALVLVLGLYAWHMFRWWRRE